MAPGGSTDGYSAADWEQRLDLREQLRFGRQRARTKLTAMGEGWRAAYGVSVIPRTSLMGCNAYVTAREIEVPWPTTTGARLYVFAEQIAHVILEHNGRWSPYIEAFEAQLFAHRLFKQLGMKVPKKPSDRSAVLVFELLKVALAEGTKKIDPSIAAWAVACVPSHRLASRSLYDTIQGRVIYPISIAVARNREANMT